MMPSTIWVLDTNIIVSALLSPNSFSKKLLKACIDAKHLQLAFDDRIEAEYKRVLFRNKFNFSLDLLQELFDELFHQKKLVVPQRPSIQLPEPTDLPFLEVASLLDEPVLVTGNIKHFPQSLVGNVKILTPREAWEFLQTKIER